MAFDVPEEMYSKIANKYRLDRARLTDGKTLPQMREIYSAAIVRTIAENERFKDIDDDRYLAKKYEELTGSSSATSKTKRQEIAGLYKTIIEYYR